MAKKKINLMILIGGLHHGGAERVIASMCYHLDPERYRITVCWRDACGAIGDELITRGFDLIGIREVAPDVSPYLRFLVLRKIVKDRNIDIIHTHDDGSLADAAQCRLIGMKIKIIHTFHFGNYPSLKGKKLWMVRVLSRFIHQLITVGYEQEKQVRKYLLVTKSNLKTIYNGVEMPIDESNQFDMSPFLSESGDEPIVIGSISTLTKQKGLPILLEAVAILKKRSRKFMLIIAGGGPLEQELKNKCLALNLQEEVKFLGWISNAGNKLLKHFDIFCQSSLWEANSIVLLEALSAGLPIVTTDVGESCHVIDQEENGLIVKSGEARQLAESLDRLIKSPEICKAMGKSAGQKFLDQYTIDKMVKAYQLEYEALLKGS